MRGIVLAALLVCAAASPVRVHHTADGETLTSKTVGLCDTTVDSYSGYFTVTTQTKHYFYWFFESRSNPSTDPVVLWMTGGPGCSSELAIFLENGPCHINNATLETYSNPYSWNMKANVIYIDQPAGAGFSYGAAGDMDKNEAEVSRDMYNFLQAFFGAYPQFHNNDFYIFGESYAGHFVPATAHAVFTGTGPKINLKGLAVGNGLTAPEIQYQWYAQMANNNSVRPLVSQAEYTRMTNAIPGCINKIQKCQQSGGLACTLAVESCNAAELTPVEATGVNLYDIRIPCEVAPLCYDTSFVGKYLAQPSVQQALGVVGHKWVQCNTGVDEMFQGDWMQHYQVMLPDMLAAGIRVLIYAGDVDFVCNYKGNKAWTLALDWPHNAAFNAEGDHSWVVYGANAGLARSSNGFTFLQVFEAGHMVPMDQPARASAMLQTFLTNGTFY
eukprot:m.232076 g.232076  ORF g.232076 m.232076 type:complete len:442 (+) comp12297_c0_seq1:37-1362(+)